MIATMAETPSKPQSKPTPPSASTVQDGDGATDTQRQAPSKARTREPVRASLAGKRTEDGPVDVVTMEPAADLPVDGGVIVPTPGNPATEPVATAAQSHVPGRVGPRTITEDAAAVALEPGDDGQDEVLPGEILADTPEGLGRVPVMLVDEDPVGANLARITQDREDGVPLNERGQRIDPATGAVLPRGVTSPAGRVSR